jgi:tetratricopeptide (TPR) repeat protein
LGKVLYEAAFGRDRQEFPALPAEVTSRPDHGRLLELNAILLKACTVDERERYQSADELRADLELLQSGKSVKSLHARKRSWIAAKKFVLAVSAIAFVVALAYLLSNRLSPQSSSNDFVWSTNQPANDDFLYGVQALQATRSTAEAIQYFESAIQKDPRFAEAWAHLAWACYSSGEDALWAKGAAAATNAVLLDPNLAYAHSMLATAKFCELNWAEGENERKLAVRLMKPNSTSAEEILLESALNLVSCGRTNKALQDLERARRANPVVASKTREVFYAMVYAWCRRYDLASNVWSHLPDSLNAERAEACLASGDFTNFMHFRRAAALEARENPDQAKREFDALDEAFKQGGKDGQLKYWELSLEIETNKVDPGHLMRMSAIYARLNCRAIAFSYLRQAMRETPVKFSSQLYNYQAFDGLRSDQRFQDIDFELWHKH